MDKIERQMDKIERQMDKIERQTERAAALGHGINRVWCIMNGDHSQDHWEDTPSWQRASVLEGVKYHVENPNANVNDSHDYWMKYKLSEGWVYGEEKDAEKKTHPFLVPYNDLPPEQKIKDSLFQAACRIYMDIMTESSE